MRFPKTLDKTQVIQKEFYAVKDLASQPVDLIHSNVNIMSLGLVPKWAEMRLDLLISLRYNTVDKFGVSLKFNSISNPFSVQAGDIIAFVDTLTINKLSKELSKLDTLRQKIRNQFIDETKTPVGSAAFNEFKNRKALPPQYRQEGETEITYKDGKQVWGNVTRKKVDINSLPPSQQAFYKKNNIKYNAR